MDSLPPILELLQSADPTFRAVPTFDGGATTAFVNGEGYRVEFLTTNRGKDEYLDKPADMPALGGASAQPLRFMDFLIREPVRAVLLYGAGVSVLVPDPARYAVHKLIIPSRRHAHSALKRDKDLVQAAILVEALLQTKRSPDLAMAYVEAWKRGPPRRRPLRSEPRCYRLSTRTVLGNVSRPGGGKQERRRFCRSEEPWQQ